MTTPVEVKELGDLFGTPEDGKTGFLFGGPGGDELLNKDWTATGHYRGGECLQYLLDSAGKPIALLGGWLGTDFLTLDGQPTEYFLGNTHLDEVFYKRSNR